MAIERFYARIDPVPFTQNGLENGLITIQDTACFKVKMLVIVKAIGFDDKRLQVKRVINSTQMILGPEEGKITAREDMSMYTLAVSPTVEAFEQERPKIPPEDFERAVYEEEPTVAKRTYLVDKYGNPYTLENPLPTDAVVNVNRANSQSLIIVNLPNKNNEVPLVLPDNTKYYQIRVRDSKDVLKIGLGVGEIAAGNYWTVNFGNIFDPGELVDYPSGYTLYFQAKNKDDITLEIFVYRKI